jgi:menaquinone-dependent protoporphyrinogen oxidase
VDVRAVTEVAHLDGYGAVVLGAPFYLGKMQKDAVTFLARHRAALEDVPTALFALGPLHAEDDMAAARAQMDDVLASMDWLKPVAAKMFVGKYDPKHLRLADKLITLPPASPLHGLGAHDDRDWEAIRSWATTLPSLLAAGQKGRAWSRSSCR